MIQTLTLRCYSVALTSDLPVADEGGELEADFFLSWNQ